MMWPEEIQFVCIWPLFVSIFLFIIARHFYHKFYHKDDLPKSSLGMHSWTRITDLSKTSQCSICQMLLMNNTSEYFCDFCGACADIKCIPNANANILCKQITCTKKESGAQCSMKHHWIQGYMLSKPPCEVCEEECDLPEHPTFQCIWCQRTVHPLCKPKIAQVCDFGIYKKFIIPPHCITLETKRAGVRFRKSHVITVESPKWNHWTPLIVLGNRKSGNGDGSNVLTSFRRILNPIQVVDLADKSPEEALQWVSLIPSCGQTLLLAAGGDGTIAWILNSVHKMQLDPPPSLGIVPLGTGNDLSRVLGWGPLYQKERDSVNSILDNLTKSKIVQLDRWLVEIKPVRHLRLTRTVKSIFMYNYLSMGVDAQVALDFHNTRESSLYIFSSRAFNMALFESLLRYGLSAYEFASKTSWDRPYAIQQRVLKSVFKKDSVHLNKMLNIQDLHSDDSLSEKSCCREQEIDDEKLEVTALYSSFHMARLQVGLSEPVKLGQASHVKIKLLSKTPMQVDGEPWLQSPAVITLSYVNKANVLHLDSIKENDISSSETTVYC